MGIGAALVQGGLLTRDVQQYEGQRAEQDYRLKQIQSGIKDLDAKEAMRPAQAELERLKSEIAAAELQFKKASMPEEQAIATAERGIRSRDVAHRGAMQPGQQSIDRATQTAQTTLAQGAAAAAPGQVELAQAGQADQLAQARERQMVRLYGLLRTGDKDGFLKSLNDSTMVAQGRKFSDVVTGSVNTAQGPVKVVQFIPGDDGPPVTVPLAQLEQLDRKYNTKYEKVGNNLLRIGPDGKVDPVYEQEQFMVVPEGGSVASRKTGQITGGGAAAAGGIGGAPTRKQQDHLDGRVKMAIDKIIMPRYGGKFEGGVFFPDPENRDVATRAVVIAGELVRRGMDPEAAGAQAIQQAEYEKELGQMGGKPGASAPKPGSGYQGPAPWRAPPAPAAPQGAAPVIDPRAAAASTPVPALPAARPTAAASARAGTMSQASKLVEQGGLTGLISAVEQMYPPRSQMQTLRGGQQVPSQVDSPEVAKLKSLTGSAALRYADELLAGRMSAGAQ